MVLGFLEALGALKELGVPTRFWDLLKYLDTTELGSPRGVRIPSTELGILVEVEVPYVVCVS